MEADFATRHATVPGRRMVELSVKDTGAGIPAGTLERIFGPFFTTKALAAAPASGRGARHRPPAPGGGRGVERAGAGLHLSDPPPGHRRGAHRGRAAPEPGPAHRGTVLVVEDDASVRQGLARLLERSGFRALTADDAESALALLGGVAVDLVILDAVLPGLSGLAAYRTIHQRHPGARVLVVSGYGEGQMDPELRRQPGTSFLAKPFTHSELLEAVHRVLAARAG